MWKKGFTVKYNINICYIFFFWFICSDRVLFVLMKFFCCNNVLLLYAMKLALFFVASVMNPTMYFNQCFLSGAHCLVCFYLESIFWNKQVYDDKRKGDEFEGLSVKINVSVHV